MIICYGTKSKTEGIKKLKYNHLKRDLPVRKILVSVAIVSAIILIGGITYLLTRPCDYRASFTVKTSPDIAYFNILNWDIWNRKQATSKIEITSKDPVRHVSNRILLNDTTLIFNWEFNPLNDSITTIRACVSDPERRFFNRLTAPFLNTPFKNGVRGNLLDIKTRLELMLKTFHYEFTGYSRFDKRACVYITFKSTQRGKAREMISNVVKLNQFVKQNNLGLDQFPRSKT